MNRIDRLVATLIHLQSKRVVKAEEIAKRFDISLRTVYRDIRALEEAGVPIGAEAGLGYFIIDGYQLPPVMFTREEAAALLTGEKLLEKLTDKSLATNYSTAMKKVRAVMKTTDKEFLEKLDGGIKVFHTQNSTPYPEQLPNHFSADIQNALATQRVLDIEYYSAYNDTFAHRKIEPVGIFYINNKWHLIAYCRLRNDYRDFRMDRVKSLHILDETFVRDKNDTLDAYFDREMTRQEVKKMVIRINNKLVPYIREQKFHYGLIEERMGETHTEMTFFCSSYNYFASWVVSWGCSIEIVSPLELKSEVIAFVERLKAHYIDSAVLEEV